MKKSLLAIVLLAVSATLVSNQTLPEAEFSGRPYILTPDNKLDNLERADAQVDVKVKALGYGGSETYYTVFSAASPVSFSKEKLPRLLIKLDGNTDPAEVVVLSKAIIKKDRRRFLQGSNALGGKARNISDSFVPLEFKKLKEGLFEIILPADIAPGEYGFMPITSGGNTLGTYNANVKIGCFGVK